MTTVFYINKEDAMKCLPPSKGAVYGTDASETTLHSQEHPYQVHRTLGRQSQQALLYKPQVEIHKSLLNETFTPGGTPSLGSVCLPSKWEIQSLLLQSGTKVGLQGWCSSAILDRSSDLHLSSLPAATSGSAGNLSWQGQGHPVLITIHREVSGPRLHVFGCLHLKLRYCL